MRQLGSVALLFVLVGCVGVETDAVRSERDSQSIEWQDLLAPHGGSIRSTEPGLKATLPDGEWQQFKTILRQGSHLSVSASMLSAGEVGSLTVELYRWEGGFSGWEVLMQQSTGGTSSPPRPCDMPDAYGCDGGIGAHDPMGTFRPLQDWQVPADGVYLVAIRSDEAVYLEMLLDTAERVDQASSCADDHGLCQRMDDDFVCAEKYRTDAEGYFVDLELSAHCMSSTDAHPFWGYVVILPDCR